MIAIALTTGALSLACASGSSAQPASGATDPVPPVSGMREVFPGVRADVKAKVVEFDGEVPIDCHDPKTPLVYLEVMVCTPDTKEHETLVVTKAKPSHVHAALLACGFNPGKPGSWTWNAAEKKLESRAPIGDALDVFIAYTNAEGKEVEARASEWVTSAPPQEGRTFEPREPEKKGWWVFAGSTTATRAGREVYDADGTGTLIGLTTFGMETVAWRDVISHEASVQEPEWVANATLVPKVRTKVVVRIRGAGLPALERAP